MKLRVSVLYTLTYTSESMSPGRNKLLVNPNAVLLIFSPHPHTPIGICISRAYEYKVLPQSPLPLVLLFSGN